MEYWETVLVNWLVVHFLIEYTVYPAKTDKLYSQKKLLWIHGVIYGVVMFVMMWYSIWGVWLRGFLAFALVWQVGHGGNVGNLVVMVDHFDGCTYCFCLLPSSSGWKELKSNKDELDCFASEHVRGGFADGGMPWGVCLRPISLRGMAG